MLALRSSNVSSLNCFRSLVGQGASLNLTDKNGRTALHLFADEGNVESVVALIDQGAELNMTDENGLTALHLAVNEGNGKSVVALIDQGAEFDVINNNGNTPLMLARLCLQFYGHGFFGHAECVEILTKAARR